MKTRDIIVGLLITALVILYLLQKDKYHPKNLQPNLSVYLSVDRTCAEPILRQFEQESNITLHRHYLSDTDAKNGFLKQLIESNGGIKADLYWSFDPIDAMILKDRNLTTPYRSPYAEKIPARFKDRDGAWTGIAGRLRLLLVHRGARPVPTGIEAFIDPAFKGRGVTATPLSGSQRVYIAALLHRWGPDRIEAFLRKLRHNVTLTTDDRVSGNLVSKGDYHFTLIDSNEARQRIHRKEPVVTIFPDQMPKAPGALLIPDVIVPLRSSSHPDMTKKLIDFLLRPDISRRLAAECGKIPLQTDIKISEPLLEVDRIKTMKIDYNEIAKELPLLRNLLTRWKKER